MNLSQIIGTQGPYGTTLKAWALINGSTGAVVSGSGLTFSSKSTGQIVLTIGGSLLSSANGVVCVLRTNAVGASAPAAWASVTTTTQMQINSTVAGSAADLASFHVELWA